MINILIKQDNTFMLETDPSEKEIVLKIVNWQLATPVFYKISLDNDPTPLLELIDVTCCPCHVCVSLNVTPMTGYCCITLFCIALFLHLMANLFYQHVCYWCFLHLPDETR